MTTDAVDLSISQFLEAWRIFGRACPATKLLNAGAAEYIFTGLPIAFFNVVVVTARQVAAPLLDATARSAMHWAHGTGAPWLFVVTHEALEPGVDAAATLEPCGLVPLLPLTGMLARRIPHDGRVPVGLQLEVPEDDAGCCDVIDVNSAAYGMDLAASKRLALHVAAEKFGDRPTFLHATDAGRPIYARMGYEATATHTCFIDKRLLEVHTS